MHFGLCNVAATFQRCMLSIFSDMVENCLEVFMDNLTVWLFWLLSNFYSLRRPRKDHLGECLLDFVILLHHFKDVC